MPTTPAHYYQCPDQGACHHNCRENMGGLCWRTFFACPLSGAYPDGHWPTIPMATVRVHQPPTPWAIPHKRDLMHHGAVRSRPTLPDIKPVDVASVQVLEPDRWAAAFPPDAYHYR